MWKVAKSAQNMQPKSCRLLQNNNQMHIDRGHISHLWDELLQCTAKRFLPHLIDLLLQLGPDVLERVPLDRHDIFVSSEVEYPGRQV